jgi:hypothetical protein
MNYAFQDKHPPTKLTARVAQTNSFQQDDQPWFVGTWILSISNEMEGIYLVKTMGHFCPKQIF